MTTLLSKETSYDLQKQKPDFAVIPIGAYEQHGEHLPMVTDTLMAVAISEAIAKRHNGFVLSPITISCSQEHNGFYGSAWISITTLINVLNDITNSLEKSGIEKVVIVNGHGGNYGINNFAQEKNLDKRQILILPAKQHHLAAAKKAGIEKSLHDDMHGGEYETSVLLSAFPDYVKCDEISDHQNSERPLLTLFGMKEYTEKGIIGFPSLASAEKGAAFLEAIGEVVSSDLHQFLEL